MDELRALEDPEARPLARLSKGIHVVLPLEVPWRAGVASYSADHRTTFAVPWEDMLLVGTTDRPYDGRPEAASVEPDRGSHPEAHESRCSRPRQRSHPSPPRPTSRASRIRSRGRPARPTTAGSNTEAEGSRHGREAAGLPPVMRLAGIEPAESSRH